MNILSLGVTIGDPAASHAYAANINVPYTVGSADGSLSAAHSIISQTYSAAFVLGQPPIAIVAVGIDSVQLANATAMDDFVVTAQPPAPQGPAAPQAAAAVSGPVATTRPTPGDIIGQRIKDALNDINQGAQTIVDGGVQIVNGIGQVIGGLQKLLNPFK